MSLSAEKRTTSQNSVLPFEDFDPLLFTNSHFYGALFEFCQGSLPETLWEDGIAPVSNYEAFKMFVVNAQIPKSPIIDEKPEPIVVLSTYEGLSYIAVYSFVLDVEAKRFLRPIVLVLASINPDIVEHVNFLYISKFIDVIDRICKSAADIFPKELRLYACSLIKCAEKHKENPKLDQKLKEIENYLQTFNVTDLNADEGVDKCPEYFLLMHNDLRPLSSIVDLTTIVSDLTALIDSLPTSLLCSSIALRGDVFESEPAFSFAGVDQSNGFSQLAFKLFSHNYEDNRYSIRSFVQQPIGIFHHCVYTILSGQTLVIQSESFGVARSLAKKFSIVIPFFTNEMVVEKDTATATECMKYSIVILRKLTDNYSPNHVSVLNLDTSDYKGERCPPGSFVATRLGKVVDVSERAFLISLYSELKRISTDFVMALAMEPKIEKTPEKLFDLLKNVGLGRDDEPIFMFWISSYFNKMKCKPILRPNSNKLNICKLDFQ